MHDLNRGRRLLKRLAGQGLRMLRGVRPRAGIAASELFGAALHARRAAPAGGPADSEWHLRQEIAASGLFDAAFYARRHAQTGLTEEEALSHYVRTGLAGNLQPSLSFDPALYAALNPDAAATGEAPLLHFIRKGRAEGRQIPDERAAMAMQIEASNLFDPSFYTALYPEVARAGLGPLEHFMRYGAREGRRPSVEFDPVAYLEDHPDVAEAGEDPLTHYVLRGRAQNRAVRSEFTRETLQSACDEIAASGLFDAAFYLERAPTVQARGVDPVLHYLVEGARFHLDPSRQFSAAAYAARQPGFVVAGNPLLRYLREGRPAGELPPRREEIWESASTDALGADVTVGRMETIAYCARYGFSLEPSGPATYVADAVADLALNPPAGFGLSDAPDVSIVIPVYGQMPFVVGCLDALRHHRSRFSVEILVADDASPAEYRTRLLEGVPWIRYRRGRENLGFLDNCNVAVAAARGRYVVLLNSDTRVLDGWLDALIGTFDLFPNAGFVGSKLLNADGSLQEAGGIYWSDGTAWNYGRNGSPDDPRFNFSRQVDWVSGASIAVPMAVWREVGGFDQAYRPAYCEDVDLAFRIRERGHEIWYQPLSRVFHFEGMTHGRDEASGIKAYQRRNLKLLQRRWSGRLPGQRPGGLEPHREADRSASKRMLVIDANIHMPNRDAGSVVASQMMRAFRQLGYRQTFVPLHGFDYHRRYVEACQQEGVEVLYAPFFTSIQDVLENHACFDYVLLYRYGIARDVLAPIRRAMPLARVLFSNVDLHFLRMEREAAVKADRSLRIAAARTETEELAVFAEVDCSIVHTPEEAQIVAERVPVPPEDLVVFPWVSTPVYKTPDRGLRRDVMFLGGFPHTPNVDAVVFFMEQVWPLLSAQLPADARFLVVGNAPPNQVRAYAGERVVVTGHVPEVEPYFAQARVFVAPLRYGAGIKGKVIQSLALGVPTVASRVATEGIPVVDGQHVLLADTARDIADAVLRLYDDPGLWASLRAAGHKLIEDTYSWSAALKLCDRTLDIADATWLERERRARASTPSRLGVAEI